MTFTPLSHLQFYCNRAKIQSPICFPLADLSIVADAVRGVATNPTYYTTLYEVVAHIVGASDGAPARSLISQAVYGLAPATADTDDVSSFFQLATIFDVAFDGTSQSAYTSGPSKRSFDEEAFQDLLNHFDSSLWRLFLYLARLEVK